MKRLVVGLFALTLAASALLTVPSTAQAAPTEPRQLSPTSGSSVASTPVLEWQPVADAERYEVHVSANDAFSPLLYSVKTDNRRVVPNVQLPVGQIFWRVRALDATGAAGPWSIAELWRDPDAGPALLSPTDPTQPLDPTREAPLLSWAPVPGATSYEVNVDDESEFVQPAVYSTKTPSYVVPAPQPLTDVYWRVRALRANGTATSWSESARFQVDRLPEITVISPADGVDLPVTDIVFDWEPVKGAEDYELQVSSDPGFGTLVENRTGLSPISGTRFSPKVTYDNASYWWRVRARDAAGHALPWSEVDVHTFHRAWPTDKPTLQYPADTIGTAVGDPFYFQWSPVPHATYYAVEMGTNREFSPGTYARCVTRGTTYTPGAIDIPGSPDDLCMPAPGTVYFWRVQAVDGPAPVFGQYSDVHAFVYDPLLVENGPQRVEQLAPVQDQDGTVPQVPVPTLHWAPARNMEKYDVEVRDSQGAVVASTTTYSTSWTPRTRLAPGDGPFSWTVVAVDHDGRRSPKPLNSGSAVFDVLADAPSATTTSPAPLDADDPYATTRVPALRWQPVTGAAKYQLFVGVAGSASDTFKAVPGTFAYPAATDERDTHLAAGDYAWFVRAYAADGSLLATGDVGTFRVRQLGAVTGQRVALTGMAFEQGMTCGLALVDGQRCSGLRQTPVFDWDPVPGAGSYLLYLAKDPKLTSNKVYSPYVATQNTRFSPVQLLPESTAGDAYYWFVRPCKTLTRCAPDPTSATHAFDKVSNPVQLIAPTDGSVAGDEVTFDWRDYLETNQDAAPDQTDARSTVEAKVYNVEIDTDRSFAVPLVDVEVDQTTYAVSAGTLPDGPLYWRVRAVDGSTQPNQLAWSEVRQVTKRSQRPVVTRPVDAATTSTTPYLTWGPVALAGSYEVEVYKNGDTAASLVNRVVRATPTQAAYAPKEPLPTTTGPYVWRVRRLDTVGRPGTWSSDCVPSCWSTFTVHALPPAQNTPGASAYIDGADSLFTWSAVHGATSYRFERRKAGAGSNSEMLTTPNLAWAPTVDLADSTWEWRVSALDAAGKTMAASGWRRFLVDGEDPEVTQQLPSGSPRASTNWVVTFSEPVRGVNGATMRLYRHGSPDPLTASVTGTNGGRTWTLNPSSPMAENVRYTLKLGVGITDKAGNSIAATSYSRVVGDTTRPRLVRKAPGLRTTPRANWAVTFSEPVRRVSGTTMRLYRAGRSGAVRARITSSNGGRTWTLNPSTAMARRVRYTLKLSSGISDRAGNRLRATSYSSTVSR